MRALFDVPFNRADMPVPKRRKLFQLPCLKLTAPADHGDARKEAGGKTLIGAATRLDNAGQVTLIRRHFDAMRQISILDKSDGRFAGEFGDKVNDLHRSPPSRNCSEVSVASPCSRSAALTHRLAKAIEYLANPFNLRTVKFRIAAEGELQE